MKFTNDNRHSLIDFSQLKRIPPFAKTHSVSITSLSLVIIMLAITLLSVIQITSTPRIVHASTVQFANTSVGTSYWVVPNGVTSVTVLVVAGGGGGGSTPNLAYNSGGGGGGGGINYSASYAVTPGANITIIVGGGGNPGGNGNPSSFNGSLSAAGGGAGGSASTGATGGSGGGGGTTVLTEYAGGGVSPSGQGNIGGRSHYECCTHYAAGGGGGAGAVGAEGSNSNGGAGGAGVDYSSIFGTGVGASGWFSGGGGGGDHSTGGTATAGGASGASGNGNGNSVTVANSGGGGGGAYCTGIGAKTGGSGGSGVVIVKYTVNNAPTVTSVTLQQSDKATATNSMTPQTAYNVEIVAGDADTINDINQIDIWVFRDDNAGDDGAPAGAWDCDHEAIYRWAKSGSTWSMQNGAITTTWSIATGSCDTPGDMAATSGEWNLYFTVGKLAQESDSSSAEWDIKVTVTDSVANTVSSTIYSKSMGAYSSLALSDSTISFGNIALGGTAAIQTPVSHYITLQAIANDAFALGSKSSSTWINGGDSATLDVDGSPAAGYFSLTQDDAGDGSGHPTTPQYITTSTVTITGHSADTRTSTASGASESTSNTNIYMDCILGSSGLKVVTYSGTITFTITNS